MTDLNIPPSSQEAEDAILGAIIDSPSILDEVSTYLSEDIFYYNKSRRLYSVILNMNKKYWNKHYRKFNLNRPSNFAKYCLKYIRKKDRNIDVILCFLILWKNSNFLVDYQS